MTYRSLITALILGAAVSVPARAQQTQQERADRWLDDCHHDRGRDDERYCEVRNLTVEHPAHSITFDGGTNGGITMHGWDKPTMLVVAMVEANADRESDARDIASHIKVNATADRVEVDGPSTRRHEGWSVSYDVYLPRQTDVDASTHNGGISVDDVHGRLELETTNGGLRLTNVSGDVHANTTNGGVMARLSGSTWDGQGLELRTTNGGVTLEMPKDYNARLETGTTNGSFNVDFPITVQGSLGRHFTTTLGKGGPLIQATTVNGGVRISSR